MIKNESLLTHKETLVFYTNSSIYYYIRLQLLELFLCPDVLRTSPPVEWY